ncbi:hypothetical protein MasN3_42210 [Massilia varians]|uniref:Uncharacterized protein n=1 Tax=Massilia varians TaxID=457921 RepID=A0ABN6TEV8_9BURK|nr:hypothetical protein [Massilia varians]BDT60727.1 hypothetical protein MasN3_42210 [Massilia varians]
MSSRIHPQARTTPKIRQEIKDSGLSDREAAKVFGITRATGAKWLKRDNVHPDVARSGIARLLKREGMSRLEDVIPKAEGEIITPKKTFKDYEPGFIHIDIKYLPQMPDETSRRYLFVAIDRATRWVFMHIYPTCGQTVSNGHRCPQAVHREARSALET